ncbi:2662_t:CDS:2 [Racocetra fulgida]|uniref:2662_t:CDS:1 n=1 Tax=Racocetra fulgida TaxID=60492 RepID=A0A9N9C659_9GLOM|nr:2662_t:CDS:2 [Racocetra fulgida]
MKKHKSVSPEENILIKIQDTFKVQNQHILRHINDEDASIDLSELSKLTINPDGILNSKQPAYLNLITKFKGYAFDNNDIKNASEQVFTINIDKVESKTQINNVIEKVEKCESKLEALFKRNLMSCKNISNILPCLSVSLGVPLHSSYEILDRITTTECSYRIWEKEEITISKQNINPTNAFIEEVKGALKCEDKESQLRMIAKKYGTFYARRLVFGGAVIKETSIKGIIIRIIGGIKEYNGFSLRSWINSLDNRDVWDIIEYDEIYSIFDLLDDNLQKEIFDILAGIHDIPPYWDFSKNASYVHLLATQFTDLDKLTKINNCYIFASIINKSDRDRFSLQIGYMNEHIPLIIIHLKKPLHKNHKSSQIRVGWIIVGQPINFDFDQINYPVLLESGDSSTFKIEFSKDEELNTCVLGIPEINSKYLTDLSVYDIKDINQLVDDKKVLQRTALFS